MTIKTLNTLLSLIPQDSNGGGGDDSDKPEDTNEENGGGEGGDDGEDKGDDKGEGSDGDSSDGDTEGDSSDSDGSDSEEDKGSDTEKGGDHSEGGKNADDSVGTDDDNYEIDDKMKDIAKEIADEIENGGDGGLKDKDDVVQEVIGEEKTKANTENMETGEAPYNPLTTQEDKVRTVPDALDYNGKPINSDVLEKAAGITGGLRTGLQRLVRGMEMTAMRHGTRTGRSLSERRYAKTWGAMKSGKPVTNPYKRRSDKLDTSIAVSVVVDQSGSMWDKLEETQVGMIALASAIDQIGGAIEVVGYRNGKRLSNSHHSGYSYSESYLRTKATNFDVFMEYGERFNTIKHRFSRLKAQGCTPTADGIQFGLDGLSERGEAHRVMFVLTDGAADGNHRPVIKRQIRLAREAGISIIGVGLGYGTEGVVREYDESVYCDNLKDLPSLLIAKLKEVFDPSEKNRGRKVRRSA